MYPDHDCVDREGFEVMLVAYPHALWRCKICQGVTRMLAIDDLPDDELAFASEMIKRYRRAHGTM